MPKIEPPPIQDNTEEMLDLIAQDIVRYFTPMYPRGTPAPSERDVKAIREIIHRAVLIDRMAASNREFRALYDKFRVSTWEAHYVKLPDGAVRIPSAMAEEIIKHAAADKAMYKKFVEGDFEYER